MGRERKYASDAERQRAYRERKAEEVARLRGSASKRKVSARLVKVLGMLGSDQAGERDNAARMASQILKMRASRGTMSSMSRKTRKNDHQAQDQGDRRLA
jgi:hypothetical protein